MHNRVPHSQHVQALEISMISDMSLINIYNE